jgi:hypothetical protein
VPDKVATVAGRDAPLPFQVRLQIVCLSVRRTVW